MQRHHNAIRFCMSFLILLVVIFTQLGIHPNNVSAQETGDDESWIAVSGRSNGLFILHPDGTGLLQIADADADNNTYIFNLNWSPDGQSLAYAVIDWETRRASIWVYHLGSEVPVRLIENSHGGFDWYPDGSAILYDKYAEREERVTALVTCDVDYLASGPFRFDGLFRRDLNNDQDVLVVPAHANYPLHNPEFSPDGTHVLFQQHEWDSPTAYYNDHPQYVTSIRQPGQFHPLPGTLDDCDWSNDSQKIACGKWDGACAEGDSCPLVLFNPEGSEISRIPAAEPGFNFQPVWSPLNNELVFSSSEFRSFADGPCFGGSKPGGSPSSNQNDFYSFQDNEQRTLFPGSVQDWSPDGRRLLIFEDQWTEDGNSVTIENHIYITDIESKHKKFLAEGELAAWQPGLNNKSQLDELVSEKNELISQLEKSSFTTFYGQNTVEIIPFNEQSARDLIIQLESQEIVPDEQLAAFQRLVLQEEAIAHNLDDAVQLAGDLGETTADTFKIFWGLGELAAGTSGNLQSALMSASFRVQLAFMDQFDDPKLRLAAQDSFDFMMEKIAANDDVSIANLLAEILLSDLIVTDSTPRYLSRYTDPVQSEIEKGVRSAGLQGEKPWEITGTHSAAELEAQRAKSVSQIASGTAHEIYSDVQNRSQLSEIITDISDLLVNASGRSLTWLNVWAVLTRIPSILVEMYQDAVLSNALACVTYMSSGAGELIFNPTGEFEECPQLDSLAQLPEAPKLPDWFDRDALDETKPTWTNQSIELLAYLEENQTTLTGSDNVMSDSLVTDFETLSSNFFATNHLTQTLLFSPDDSDLSQITEPVALELLSLDIELLAYEIALAAFEEDPGDQEAQEALEFSSGALQERLISIPEKLDTLASLPGGGQSAIPVILEAPADIQMEENLPKEITVTISNFGSLDLQSARLTVSIAGEEITVVDLQSIPAGDSVQQLLSFTPPKSDRKVLEIELSGNGRTDTIWIPITTIPADELVELQSPDRSQGTLTRWPGFVFIAFGIIFVFAGSIGLFRLRSKYHNVD